MTIDDTERRGRLLYVTLGFLGLDVAPAAMPPGLATLHRWLDSWTGIGLIELGMARQDWDLALTRYADAGWQATFYVKGREHSAVSSIGTGWQPTPWAAVHQAAWAALYKAGYGRDARSVTRRPRESYTLPKPQMETK